MAQRFKKAPAFMGKYLSLYVGGGDKVISDHEILEGPHWSKFVGLGMLVALPDEPESAPKPAPKPVVVPKPETKKAVASSPPPKIEVAEPEPEPEPVVPAHPMEPEDDAEAQDGSTTKSPAPKWGGKRRKGK